MATTAARMQQRRRTAAQWTSENPILAVGEVGVEIGGTQPIIKVGDGTTAWTSLPYYDLATFDRYLGGAAIPTGTAAASTSNGWGGWLLLAPSTGGVSFVKSFPAVWTTATMSWGYVPLTSGANNIRWSANVRRCNALGFGDLISDAPQHTDTFTQAASGGGVTLQMEHCFNHPTTFDVHNSDAVLGEVVNITIERIGGDAADTCTSDVLLTNFSVNRLT